MNSLLIRAKLFLKGNPELLAIRSDKSNSTLRMNKNEYQEKILSLLQLEEEIFLVHSSVQKNTTNSNPTTALQNKNN